MIEFIKPRMRFLFKAAELKSAKEFLMKKGIVFMVLVTVLAGTAFSQDGRESGGPTHWISGELNMMGSGIKYEYQFMPNLTFGANFFKSDFRESSTLVAGVFARYYPFSGRVFFAEIGLGYGTRESWADWKNDDFEGGVSVHEGERYLTKTVGVAISPAVGWRIDIGRQGAFFLEPGVRIPITIGGQEFIDQRSLVADWTAKNKAGAVTGFDHTLP